MFTPGEVAKNAVGIAKTRANLPLSRMFALGIMAGMFIAFASVGSNTVSCTVESGSIAKLLCGCVFPGGLAMVILAGSELFTGNSLMIVGVLEKEIKLSAMIRNLVVVYLGNFTGSMLIVLLAYGGGQYDLFGGALAVNTIRVAATKCSLTFGKAVCLGILCNFLVCIAVWISFAAKTVGAKIAGIFFPIFLFILCGFEHSIANMYFIPAGLIANTNPAYHAAAVEAVSNIGNLTVGNFLLNNLIPVTIGNMIGGIILVGCMYWFIYLKKDTK